MSTELEAYIRIRLMEIASKYASDETQLTTIYNSLFKTVFNVEDEDDQVSETIEQRVESIENVLAKHIEDHAQSEKNVHEILNKDLDKGQLIVSDND